MKSKKIISLLILISSLSLLSACGKDEPSLEERLGGQVAPLESFEGTIEGISIDVYQQGTHQLKTEDEGTIYIQSPSIDLNKYIGKQVIVQGVIKKGMGKVKPVLTVSKIQYVTSSEPVQEGFKLYENKDFGLKFEYLSTWLPKEANQSVDFSFEEKPLFKVTVFSDQPSITSLLASKEQAEGEEVTIAAQRSFRFTSGSDITFYVPNPPKKKIYQIKFTPPETLSDEGKTQELKAQFYDLLKSLQLIYLSQSQGEVCGGEPPMFCPEDYFCELADDSNFAEGVCVPIGGSVDPNNCPLIEAPNDCSDYRIAHYTESGCPLAYECTDEAGEHTGTDFIPEAQDSLGEENFEDLSASELTGNYVNNNLDFTMNYPKNWYYISFGPLNGQETIGFSKNEFDEPEQALITLTLQKNDGGKASKKIGDLYYVFDGPSDLTQMMKEMATSLEKNRIL